MRWVHYNDVMARISIRHWGGDNVGMLFSPTIVRPTVSVAHPEGLLTHED